MKNKTYLKNHRKKSIASLFLAFLLMISFNASTIALIFNTFNSADAYKSSSTKTYYTDSTKDTEGKFDADYPSSYEKYFENSSSSFNVLDYYNTEFETSYKTITNDFFKYYYKNHVSNGENLYNEFLTYYGVDDEKYPLYAFYSEQKNSNVLTSRLETITYQKVVEYIAINGLSNYDPEKSLPSITTNDIEGTVKRLSEFYRYLRNYIANPTNPTLNDHISDDQENGANYELLESAFYNANTHYLAVKKHIDDKITSTAPAYVFDNETQDASIAGIIANGAPLTVSYNYKKNGSNFVYEEYSKPYTPYITKTPSTTSATKNAIYYFGSKEEVEGQNTYTNNSEYFEFITKDKSSEDILLYKRIENGEFGYISETYPTYYKFTNKPYTTSSSRTAIYVLNDNPTQSALDTYESIYFKTMTSQEYNSEKDYYINIPYENDNNDDELYFKAIYGNILYSQKGFTFDEFVDYFTNGKTSLLYVKLTSSNTNIVYVDSAKKEQLEALNGYTEYSAKGYKIEIYDSSSWIEDDYDEILNSGSSTSYFFQEASEADIKLYFKKVKVPYEGTTTNTYKENTYETTTSPLINLEKHDVASSKYETVSETDSTRKIYALSEDGSVVKINEIDYAGVKQSDIDNNPNYYVSVPDYVYTNNNIDKETYKLYYRHTSTNVSKIYVVDDSDTASESKIYQTLNYTPIKTSELSNNYTNYISVQSGDANYNKNFKLYYKYDRSTVNSEGSQVYVLESDNYKVANTGNYTKTVKSNRLTDYILIDKESNSSLYEAVYNTLVSPTNDTLNKEEVLEELMLYYKLSDVFVQNEIANRNAIYVVDSSLSTSDKETYTENMFTAITKTELEDNPNLYVKIESYDPYYQSEDVTYYYKYKTTSPVKKVYSIEDISTTASDFDSKAYELITSGDENYKEGSELYYKKVLEKTEAESITKNTFYTLKTSATVSLSADSYYAISFYVQTIGEKTQASFGIKDTAGVLDDINLNNITTHGKWEKYYIFIATNASTASTINLYLYLGDETNGIKGTNDASDFTNGFTGSAFFDDINITKIGLTDFNKKYIDNLPVRYAETTGEGENVTETGKYVDNNDSEKNYKNYTYIANLDDRFTSNNYDARSYIDTTISTYNNVGWNNMFDFDNAKTNGLDSILGYTSSANTDENQVNKSNSLSSTINADTYGSDMYPSTNLWKYYLDRTLDSNDFNISKYRQSYLDGKLDVTITDIIEESEKEKEKDEDKDDDNEEDKEDDVSDISYVSTPFNENNYALKLVNSNKDLSLGITSNSFKIDQFGYYRISLWIYSPNLDGTATISVNSVIDDISAPKHGTLLTSSVSSVSANISKSASKSSEYGWIPVDLYIEGNNYDAMDCYLVLSAGKDCTVYFDNIRIQKITSAQYDTASSNTSSNKYSCVLSLTPTSSINSTDIKNGTFDYITETELNHTSSEPYGADNWTRLSTNSTRVTAGVVSTLNQKDFFNKYASKDSKGQPIIPTEGSNNYANVYAIYSPESVNAVDGTTSVNYRHNFSIYSGSTSLSSSTIYKITFKFYNTDTFDGNLISKIYLSSVKTENILTSMSVAYDKDDANTTKNEWQTYTYYVSTSTSSSTAYVEIGVDNAIGLCYFKDVAIEKVTTKTMDQILAEVAKDNNITESNTEDIYSSIKNVKFVNISDSDFSNHGSSVNEETGLFNQNTFTDKTETTIDHTSGKAGITSASYFDTINVTTYSVTINKVTYYIGEVYTVKIASKDYFVHKTYDSRNNKFEYTVYDDSSLTNKITNIDDQEVSVDTSSSNVNVKVGETSYTTETTYRLYKYADLREEITSIDGAKVTIESLDNVVLGSGENASENTISPNLNTNYNYHFNSQEDYAINNSIIKASDLDNAQSSNVLILSNSYSTDYISLVQSTTKTVGKSSYKVLRVYVKTSDFANSDFGLNIEVEAINVKWTNINTTNSKYADSFGFVCYEALIKTNSSDSVADVAVKLSLGDKDNLGTGYAIISKISLDTISSADEFEHYLSLIDEDNETVQKAIYEETASTTTSTDDADDKNSISWATFFYIFSSILLVVTMAVAGVAIVLKKHPIKVAQKFENEHNRDIDSIKSNKSKSDKSNVIIGETLASKNAKKDKDNSGGIV